MIRILHDCCGQSKLCISGSLAYDSRGKMSYMADLEKMSLLMLEEIATKLCHAIARNPEHSRIEQVELEDVKQWIAIRQNRDSESEP